MQPESNAYDEERPESQAHDQDQPESGAADEIMERYEKNFGAAGRRRSLILMGFAAFVILSIIIGFTRSMSYVGSLNAHVYDVFEVKDKDKGAKPP